MLEPNEEQRLLADMLARFLTDHTPAHGPGYEPMPADQWKALGELGVLAFAVPEAAGGLGGDRIEAALVGEALGRAAAMTPMAEVAVLSASLLAAGLTEVATRLLGDQIAGDGLTAYSPPGEGMGDLTVAEQDGGWVLDGERRLVRHGAEAQAYIIDTDAGLLLIDRAARGLTVTPYRLADGDTAARLTFDGVTLTLSDRLAVSPEAHARAVALGQLTLIGEMVGLMQTLYEATVEYVRERRQFGQPIGAFQAVQHRTARLFILLEQSRSMMTRAMFAAPQDADAAILEARAYVSDAALRLAQDATQLHGGMGVTQEALVGRGHRRLLVLSHLFGGALDARSRLAA